MGDWKTLSSEKVYETPWIKVRRDEVLNQDGKPLTYSVIELQHPSVFILATNQAGQIFMQRCYRYTIDRTIWNIPAGHSDEGEAPLTAAKRELEEEAGLVSDEWLHLGRLHQIIGTGNAPLDAFWAKNVQTTAGPKEELEQISDQQFMRLEEVEKMAIRGDIEDAPLLAVLYLAKMHGL